MTATSTLWAGLCSLDLDATGENPVLLTEADILPLTDAEAAALLEALDPFQPTARGQGAPCTT